MRSGQGCVSAQVYLDRSRREPSKRYDVRAWNHKSGLGKVVFSGDVRKDAIGQPVVKKHNRGRIPAEHAVRERINLV